MIVSLTGFMGSGKSSVGRRLSELLCCSFMDLDEEIESRSGKSIPEIFAEEGEDGFREREKLTLSSVLSAKAETDGIATGSASLMVLALGGGTVMRKECAEMVKRDNLCIYLRATADTLADNLKDEAEGRPMLHSDGPLRNRISELVALRSSSYENTAHIIIDTDGKTIDDIAAEIVKTICPETQYQQ